MTAAPVVGVTEIERVFREDYGRAVGVLVRHCGDIDLAEEAVQDAFAPAMQRWPVAGMPPSPAGWIITTARNRAIDRLRRGASRQDRYAQAQLLQDHDEPTVVEGPVRDDRLRVIFTGCRPALSLSAQVALTLRLLGGLTTGEIACAFLGPEPIMAQRLVRAKVKIRDDHLLCDHHQWNPGPLRRDQRPDASHVTRASRAAWPIRSSHSPADPLGGCNPS